jgi:hypothetical protein
MAVCWILTDVSEEPTVIIIRARMMESVSSVSQHLPDYTLKHQKPAIFIFVALRTEDPPRFNVVYHETGSRMVLLQVFRIAVQEKPITRCPFPPYSMIYFSSKCQPSVSIQASHLQSCIGITDILCRTFSFRSPSE